jgi:hypothetical protein
MNRLPQRLGRAARWTFFAAMVAGSLLITHASLPYFFGDEMHPFLIEKLPLPHEELWLAALHVHVVAAAFALPACVVLLSTRILRRWPRAHRVLGRIAGAVVLLALVPSGAWLALFAKGGVASTAGFLLSGAIASAAMVQGILHARAGRFADHRRCVLHVVAQLSVAVTSRAMLVGLDFAGLDPDRAYILALWLPVAASALMAEHVAGARRKHENRSRALALNPAL